MEILAKMREGDYISSRDLIKKIMEAISFLSSSFYSYRIHTETEPESFWNCPTPWYYITAQHYCIYVFLHYFSSKERKKKICYNMVHSLNLRKKGKRKKKESRRGRERRLIRGSRIEGGGYAEKRRDGE
jgi:hypothetical protein